VPYTSVLARGLRMSIVRRSRLTHRIIANPATKTFCRKICRLAFSLTAASRASNAVNVLSLRARENQSVEGGFPCEGMPDTNSPVPASVRGVRGVRAWVPQSRTRLALESVAQPPSRDREGAEPACDRSAAWSHRGSRSLTVAALRFLMVDVTMHGKLVRGEARAKHLRCPRTLAHQSGVAVIRSILQS
jgi:hypothetical protein